jgi:hypothetical protein
VLQGQGDNAICLGTQALPMLTTSHASYTPKEAVRAKISHQPALGVRIGDQHEPMQTMNQLYFTKKEATQACLPEATMKELRNTHFGMGQAPLSYQTESHNYRSVPGRSPNSQLNFKIPTYEAGTWVDKAAKFEGQTTSKRELPQREVKPFERVSQFTHSGMELGSHPGVYTT